MMPCENQKVLAFIMFAFSGLFFIIGCVSAYHMMSLDYDLVSITKSVSPILSAGIVMLYGGVETLYAHRKERNTFRIVLYLVFVFIGFIIAIVGFMVESWGVCLVGLVLALVALYSLIETYKIIKCKNDQK